MIGPGQIINILVISYQTSGIYYIIAGAYQMVYKCYINIVSLIVSWTNFS